MDKTLFSILGQISSYIVIIPLIFGISKFKNCSFIQKRIVFLLMATLLTETIANQLWRLELNNNYLFHIYAVIEFYLIASIYSFALKDTIPSRFFNGLILAFTVFAILNAFFFQSIYVFNSNVTTLLSFVVIGLSLYYFYNLLKSDQYVQLGKIPMFWINSGLLIYFSSNAILFFINNKIVASSLSGHTVWSIHAIINIFLIFCYSRALWINTK